jgi:hypothetical protein
MGRRPDVEEKVIERAIQARSLAMQNSDAK